MKNGRLTGHDVVVVRDIDRLQQRFVGKHHKRPWFKPAGKCVPSIGIEGRLRNRRGDDHNISPTNSVFKHGRQAVAISHHHTGCALFPSSIAPGVVSTGGWLCGLGKLPVSHNWKILPRNGVSHAPKGGENRMVERKRGQKITAVGAAPDPHNPTAKHLLGGLGIEPLRITRPRSQPDHKPAALRQPLR